MTCISKYAGFRNADALPYLQRSREWYGGAEYWAHYASVGEAYIALRKLAGDAADSHVCFKLYRPVMFGHATILCVVWSASDLSIRVGESATVRSHGDWTRVGDKVLLRHGSVEYAAMLTLDRTRRARLNCITRRARLDRARRARLAMFSTRPLFSARPPSSCTPSSGNAQRMLETYAMKAEFPMELLLLSASLCLLRYDCAFIARPPKGKRLYTTSNYSVLIS
eukprot:3026021-Pleurochrysis_carterae.AAC.3